MIEEWLDIIGYEGYYQISSFGRIKSLDRLVATSRGFGFKSVKGRVIKTGPDKDNYLKLKLAKLGTMQFYSVHRLVAIHFVPNPNNLPLINHKDENKQNNYKDNLEWCTVAYNNTYNGRQEKINAKLRVLSNIKINLKRKPVSQYNLDGSFIRNFISIGEAVENGFNGESVSKCCRNLKKDYKKFIWKFLD